MNALPGALAAVLAGIWACLAVLVLLFCWLIAAKAVRERREERLSRRRQALSSSVDALLAGGSAGPLRRASGDGEALEDLLIEALSVVSGPIREALVAQAESLGLVEERLEELRRGDRHRRAEAMERLGLLRSVSAVPALVLALNDEEPELRRVAARALGRIPGVQALPELVAAALFGRGPLASVAAHALLDRGQAAVAPLLEAAGRPGSARSKALALLGRLRALEALPAAIDALREDKDPEARQEAARCLGLLAHPDAAAPLRAALSDGLREVRVQAAWALGRVGDPSAAPELEKALRDGYWWVRVRAAESLARLGEPGVAALQALAGDPEPAMRALAAEILSMRQARP